MAEAAAVEVADFAGIVRQHQAMVFSIAYHFLHDRSLAEEVAQEVFLQLHQRLAEFQSMEHLSFWLRRVASHRSIDCARRRKLRPQVSLEDVPEPVTMPAARDPMLSRTLQRLVASLPEKPRMTMILRYQEDLDPSEIAETLNMPVRTVKSHLQRSLALLREKLRRSVGEENL
jgi:RNA polymerase sigma-70 factor (ECF subfamily)